jgi:hypothetical protein
MDATAICVEILRDAMPTGVEVSSEIPTERPLRQVSVSRVGGGGNAFLDLPRMRLVCWGASDEEASSIATTAVHALADAALTHPLLAATSLDVLSRDEWAGDGTARYSATVNLTINK